MTLVEAMREINETINKLTPETELPPLRIFISYASPDRAFVERLARGLESAGLDPWFDRSLAGGDDFRDRIAAEIDRADRVVAVWSRHAIASRWVRWEAARAMDQDKLVSLLDASIGLKDIPAPFTEENVLRADDVDRLVASLRSSA